jgi:hypothetical protein
MKDNEIYAKYKLSIVRIGKNSNSSLVMLMIYWNHSGKRDRVFKNS